MCLYVIVCVWYAFVLCVCGGAWCLSACVCVQYVYMCLCGVFVCLCGVRLCVYHSVHIEVSSHLPSCLRQGLIAYHCKHWTNWSTGFWGDFLVWASHFVLEMLGSLMCATYPGFRKVGWIWTQVLMLLWQMLTDPSPWPPCPVSQKGFLLTFYMYWLFEGDYVVQMKTMHLDTYKHGIWSFLLKFTIGRGLLPFSLYFSIHKNMIVNFNSIICICLKYVDPKGNTQCDNSR